jgi:hypothetical protein
MKPTWLEQARQLPVSQVAELLGLEPGRPASGHPTFACPACGAATRHTKRKDKRGAVGITRDDSGWHCFQCSAGGDAIDLVAHAVAGEKLGTNRDTTARVKAWFLDRWPQWAPDRTPGKPVPSQPVPVRKVRQPAPPLYPPAGEIADLWHRCVPVTQDREVADYLGTERALDPSDIALTDIARALPQRTPVPRWAWGPGGPWNRSGYRLICPLYNPSGKLSSLVGRAITPEAEPKSLAPAKYERRGLVLADPLAVQILGLGRLPDWWDEDVTLRVVIAEGEIDFASWATAPEAMSDLGHGPAVFGVFEGGWSEAFATRLPAGSLVQIAEQLDPPRTDGQPTAAEQYTTRILETLAARRRAGEFLAEILTPQ